MRLFVLSVSLFLSFFPLHADIFSLWPFRGNSSASAKGDSVTDILEPQKLWQEKIVINGRNMEMGVALVDRTLKDALRLLRIKYPDAPLAVNSNSVLFEIPLENGFRRRIFLVGFDGKDTIVQFTMDIPQTGLNTSVPWPSELPLPPGATPVTVMKFPARKSVYGTFKSPYDKQSVLSDLLKALRSDGWKSAGEAASSAASGDIFLRNDGSEMMVIGTMQDDKTGTSRGTLYLRRLK